MFQFTNRCSKCIKSSLVCEHSPLSRMVQQSLHQDMIHKTQNLHLTKLHSTTLESQGCQTTDQEDKQVKILLYYTQPFKTYYIIFFYKCKYHVCQFMSYNGGRSLFVCIRGDNWIIQKVCLPVSHQSPILHRPKVKIRQGNLVFKLEN